MPGRCNSASPSPVRRTALGAIGVGMSVAIALGALAGRAAAQGPDPDQIARQLQQQMQQMQMEQLQRLQQWQQQRLPDRPRNFDQPPLSGISVSQTADPPFTREELKSIAIDGDLLASVQLLDSDDYPAREKATAQLRQDETRRIQMYALLSRDTLTPEQRYRLLRIVRDQLINMPRGAIGIQMERLPMMWGGNNGAPLEIKISDVIGGFPAERLLQVGDRILALDGQPLFNEEELRERVQSKRPGDKVSITIKRAKVDENGKALHDADGLPVTETLTLDVPLGSAEKLDSRRDLNTGPSAVQNRRRIEADAIAYAFALQPLTIAIKGGAARLAHGPAAGSGGGNGDEDSDIDRDPTIVMLREEQAMLDQMSPQQAQNRREQWQRRLAELQMLATYPGLSPQDRDRNRRVLDRYLQLLKSGS